MQRSRVVLPEPLGPTITTTSPGATSRSIPCSTSNLPNHLCRSWITMLPSTRGVGSATWLVVVRKPSPQLSSKTAKAVAHDEIHDCEQDVERDRLCRPPTHLASSTTSST